MPKRTDRPASAASPAIQRSFSETATGGSPQVRYTSLYRAATGPASADDPPKYSSGTGEGSRDSRAPSTDRWRPATETVDPRHRLVTMSRNSAHRSYRAALDRKSP